MRSGQENVPSQYFSLTLTLIKFDLNQGEIVCVYE
jgi:hypothetical protein